MKLTQNHKDLINILKMLDVDSETIMALLPAVQEDEKAQTISKNSLVIIIDIVNKKGEHIKDKNKRQFINGPGL